MSVPVLTFFNNKGGVGKTSLLYHLSWMFSHLEKRVLIADIDPQANLTAAFLTEDAIDEIWNNKPAANTIYQCVKPLVGVGDIVKPELQNITENLYLLPGDVALSSFEDQLSNEWPNSMNDVNLYRPLRILSAFWQIVQIAANAIQAEIILVDIGPNLGAINRSVLIAADYVIIPMGADLFSLQGLKNLGPALKSWKELWAKRLENWENSGDKKDHPELLLPEGSMKPIGYLCQQYGVRLSRPVRAYDKWVQKIPGVYREAVLNEEPAGETRQEDDPNCISIIKHYRSLIPLAQEHRKPIFDLTPADGAIGSHANAVFSAREDFEKLSLKIMGKIGLCSYPTGPAA
ncbi:MAG: AAA family ATPase [Treponema sp.]|jgi:cellulose biosynthesis protein BcsQ|nr:AAA family ATPase [Treponema sp.]